MQEENYLDQSNVEVVHDNSSNMSYNFEESEAIDFSCLLEEIKKIDDLDILDSIQNKLLSTKQFKTETLKNISEINTAVKDELNKTKCCMKELDQLHKNELQKIENLMENIQNKKEIVLQMQIQQIEALDQFEFGVFEVVNQFTTVSKEYENCHLREKINDLNKMLEERKSGLQQQMKKVTAAQDEFEKPVEMVSMESPLEVFDCGITEITSLNKNLAQSLDQMSKEVDKLRFDMMTTKFSRQASLSKN